MKFKGEDIKISMKIEEDRIIFNDVLSVTMDEFEAITSLITNQIKIQESTKQKNEETIKLDPEIVNKIKDGMKVTWKYEDEEKMKVSFDLSMDEEVSKLVKGIKKKERENGK